MLKEIDKVFLRLHVILKNTIGLSRRQVFHVGVIFGLILSGFLSFQRRRALAKGKKSFKIGENTMNLMLPTLDGNISLEKAIKKRRTVRHFSSKPITKQQFSQLLWAAQGITEDGGFMRAAPSGGALYPADVYAMVGKNCVDDLAAGVYRYKPKDHSVVKIVDGDRRRDAAIASLRQMWMASAAVLFVVTAEYARICIKYGERGIRYALIETGHISQNIFLQCQTLGLEAGIVGAFNDSEVSEVVGAEKDHEPLIILPVGWPG
jgi:SagB-type dehydrogenase family enzyme